MIFDLTRRKIEVIFEHLIVAAFNSAWQAVLAVWAMHGTKASLFDPSVRQELIIFAVNGAFTGLIMYRMQPSRSKLALDRREDIPQIAKVAEQLGIADPAATAEILRATGKNEK